MEFLAPGRAIVSHICLLLRAVQLRDFPVARGYFRFILIEYLNDAKSRVVRRSNISQARVLMCHGNFGASEFGRCLRVIKHSAVR